MANQGSQESGSSGLKILLMVLIGGGVMLLVCCGGGYWAFQKFIGQSFTMDADQIRAKTSEISSIEMPGGYEPRMAMDLSGLGLPMKMVAYGRGQDQQSVIMLMQASDAAGGQGITRQDFEDAMAQQGQDQNIQVGSREIRVFDYAGEEHSFEFASGTTRQSDAAMRQVSGMFPTEGGLAFLMMVDAEEDWDDDAVMRMIESTGGQYLRTEEDEAQEASEPQQEQDEPESAEAEPAEEAAADTTPAE